MSCDCVPTTSGGAAASVSPGGMVREAVTVSHFICSLGAERFAYVLVENGVVRDVLQ
jgi:hypothetical protein